MARRKLPTLLTIGRGPAKAIDIAELPARLTETYAEYTRAMAESVRARTERNLLTVLTESGVGENRLGIRLDALVNACSIRVTTTSDSYDVVAYFPAGNVPESAFKQDATPKTITWKMAARIIDRGSSSFEAPAIRYWKKLVRFVFRIQASSVAEYVMAKLKQLA